MDAVSWGQKMMSKWCHWQTNKLIGHHLIIIKKPEIFPKFDEHLKSMNKLTVNDPAIIIYHQIFAKYLLFS